MIELVKRRKWEAIVIAVLLGVMWFRIGGHGPLDQAKAEELFTTLLQAERSNPRALSLPVIAPDSSAVPIPPKALRGAELVDCEKTDGRMGTTPGLYGTHNRTHAMSTHACLFRMSGPAGLTLHLGLDVFRYGKSGPDAFDAAFASPSATNTLISRLKAPLGQMSPLQRSELAALKGAAKPTHTRGSSSKPDFGAQLKGMALSGQ